MIIGACGFGETGSGVITDYLKEYDNIVVKDNFEFSYITGVDGLLYLERAVMNPYNRTGDSIYAIQRFLDMLDNKKKSYDLPSGTLMKSGKAFIDRITMVKWYWGYTNYGYKSPYFFHKFILDKIISRFERKTGHRANCWPLKEVKLSVRPENFYEAARKHVDEVLRAIGLDQDRLIVMDQPFAANNPQACFPFFNDPYAVVVDRDPRDLYVSGKTRLMGKWRFFPIDTVEDFITYYRAIRKDQPYKENHPRIFCVRFEDLVYEYDDTTAQLRDFLHLPVNPNPKSVFDPEMSIANTQVYKRYPQFADDIKKIEEALPEYLFDFSKYPEPDFSKEMFLWSPLNNFKRHTGGGYIPQSK